MKAMRNAAGACAAIVAPAIVALAVALVPQTCWAARGDGFHRQGGARPTIALKTKARPDPDGRKSAAVRPAAMQSMRRHEPEARRMHREVAVTFDDLPAPSDSVVSYNPEALQAMTARLLAELRAYRIPAIGFVNEDKLDRGEFQQRVDILKMWVNAGFGLGNHTYSHADIDTTPLASYELDFLRGEEVTGPLLLAKGMRERYFRYPFLDVGKTIDTAQAFQQFLKRQGYSVAPVTIDNQEYMFAAVYAHALATGDTVEADRVTASFFSYMNQVFAYFENFSEKTLGYEPRQVLLLHADELDTDTLGDLVKLMRARGYRFISLREALRDPAYHRPDHYDDAMDGGVSWIEHWAYTMGKDVPDGPDPPQFVQNAYQRLQ